MSFGASLLQAAKAGAIERVAALLRDGHAGSLSTPDASGSTPLHLAAVSCRGPELPTMLLAAGAAPSQQNKFRQTPLHFACACGNIHAAAVLIGCGGVDTQEAKGMTPLMLAAKRGAADLVCLLLAQGRADPLLQDHQGLTAGAHATSPDIQALLLAAEATALEAKGQAPGPAQAPGVRPTKAAAVFRASKDGGAAGRDKAEQRQVQGLPSQPPAAEVPPAMHSSQMLALIQAGQEAEALRALQAGLGSPSARASGSGASALLLASEQDMKKLVTQLLACKVDVNQARWDGATPLLVATRKRAMAAVKLLISAGADVNQADLEGCSPLLEAATMVDARLVGWLLQAGANANTHNIVGETPLMRASVQDRPEVVELLLAHGADVNACEHDLGASLTGAGTGWPAAAAGAVAGFTALTFAASQGCASVAKVLLAHGADPASTNKHGQMTALHLACRAGHLGVVAAVLAVPGGAAAVDLQDSKGLTPLMAAAMAGHTSVCAALMDAGASSSLKARGGHTAMSLAVDHHHKAVVQLLASRGVPGPAARPGSKQIHRAGPAPSRSLNALITDPPQGPSPSPSSPDLTGTAGQHFIMGASPTSRFAPAHKATRSEESPAVLPHQPFTALDSPNTPHLAISSPVLLGPTTAQNSFAGSDCTSASTLSLAAVQPTLHAASPKVSEAGAAGGASRASPLPRSRLAPPGPPSPSLTSHPASLAQGTQPVAGAARCESGSEQGRGRQGQAGPGASESGSWILGPGVSRGKQGEGAVTISRIKSDRHLQSSTPPAATPPSATQVRATPPGGGSGRAVPSGQASSPWPQQSKVGPGVEGLSARPSRTSLRSALHTLPTSPSGRHTYASADALVATAFEKAAAAVRQGEDEEVGEELEGGLGLATPQLKPKMVDKPMHSRKSKVKEVAEAQAAGQGGAGSGSIKFGKVTPGPDVAEAHLLADEDDPLLAPGQWPAASLGAERCQADNNGSYGASSLVAACWGLQVGPRVRVKARVKVGRSPYARRVRFTGPRNRNFKAQSKTLSGRSDGKAAKAGQKAEVAAAAASQSCCTVC
ncbi:hypothetical protein QJQ45_027578 [Haematococcus lacustris]|nr:hypothetical protein QJQ45_027578 [Haematococcus lacustris]